MFSNFLTQDEIIYYLFFFLTKQNSLLDLLGGLDQFDQGLMPSTAKSPVAAGTAPAPSNQGLFDLLGGLDLSGTSSQPAMPSSNLVNNNLANLFTSSSTTSTVIPPSSNNSSNNFLIDGFLGGSSTTPSPPPPSTSNSFHFST